MIALDTSALVTILEQEPEADLYAETMAAADRLLIGMPTILELRLVMTARVGALTAEKAIAALLADTVEQIAFGRPHLIAATGALDRFGKGRHRAALNFGDCMAYAVAAVAGCPLLYKGDDFAQTDIMSALTA
ncbi:type II toxin-antitoxin system VapC family toxin [Sphingomonas sp.]|uniref:type II toxin-antitoxin system VapC family toxin n=1 Tax=Sphingomonas sp. TaxID=28214 RepID=UPI003B0068B6